ncbi:lipopolysaccharide/colanic/teichoic acid biosynthesis glycosyltransferase [Aliiruegeria haliotis]|uniref:Lipopolysaccharide/colanic/teichoic acid biosynthesis glycosyltransferase n=1 Tax=Aliiruegeria haliotis TaxID=1280846 RepID=A0A2T0RSR9_9RHOB|nr:sugar transferase [Aliiruegeria haliotis]PRY24236.1 lipopolysaccharide/colanic/teichoic acid biosynthesis glycosyltransferase [Aliiruegeria haliotis]
MAFLSNDPTEHNRHRVPISESDPVESRHSRSIYRRFGKRAFDILAVLLFSPVVIPIVAAAAIAVRLENGPAFYRQKRIGKDGKTFQMVKIRTMVPDAEEHLEAYLAQTPSAKAEWDHCQKLRDDPRITRVGRVLRRTSLDELPQVWNVLIGDMSLVGPRPMMVDQTELYPGTAYRRLRPGITGPWQVSDRHETSFSARAAYDAAYERDLSFSHDVRLLAKTAGVVLRCTGI